MYDDILCLLENKTCSKLYQKLKCNSQRPIIESYLTCCWASPFPFFMLLGLWLQSISISASYCIWRATWPSKWCTLQYKHAKYTRKCRELEKTEGESFNISPEIAIYAKPLFLEDPVMSELLSVVDKNCADLWVWVWDSFKVYLAIPARLSCQLQAGYSYQLAPHGTLIHSYRDSCQPTPVP